MPIDIREKIIYEYEVKGHGDPESRISIGAFDVPIYEVNPHDYEDQTKALLALEKAGYTKIGVMAGERVQDTRLLYTHTVRWLEATSRV